MFAPVSLELILVLSKVPIYLFLAVCVIETVKAAWEAISWQ